MHLAPRALSFLYYGESLWVPIYELLDMDSRGYFEFQKNSVGEQVSHHIVLRGAGDDIFDQSLIHRPPIIITGALPEFLFPGVNSLGDFFETFW